MKILNLHNILSSFFLDENEIHFLRIRSNYIGAFPKPIYFSRKWLDFHVLLESYLHLFKFLLALPRSKISTLTVHSFNTLQSINLIITPLYPRLLLGPKKMAHHIFWIWLFSRPCPCFTTLLGFQINFFSVRPPIPNIPLRFTNALYISEYIMGTCFLFLSSLWSTNVHCVSEKACIRGVLRTSLLWVIAVPAGSANILNNFSKLVHNPFLGRTITKTSRVWCQPLLSANSVQNVLPCLILFCLFGACPMGLPHETPSSTSFWWLFY